MGVPVEKSWKFKFEMKLSSVRDKNKGKLSTDRRATIADSSKRDKVLKERKENLARPPKSRKTSSLSKTFEVTKGSVDTKRSTRSKSPSMSRNSSKVKKVILNSSIKNNFPEVALKRLPLSELRNCGYYFLK